MHFIVSKRIWMVLLPLWLFVSSLHADFNPTNPPEPNVTQSLVVDVDPTGAASVSGTGKYREGVKVTVRTYSPKTNYKFSHWTINGYAYDETNMSFQYTMGDTAVVFIAHYTYEPPPPAPFEPTNPPEPSIKLYVTVDIDPEEGGTTSGSGSFTSGQKTTIKANVKADYEFLYWTLNGYKLSTTATSFTYQVADTNARFVAHVAKKHIITLETKPRAAGKSTMTIDGTKYTTNPNKVSAKVAKGKKINFTTTSSNTADYPFRHWTINDVVYSTSTSFEYTVGDKDANVVAIYDYVGSGDTTLFNPTSPPEPDLREDITIEVYTNDSAVGIADGGGIYPYGTIVTLNAYPAEGFAFRYWNDGNQDNPRTIQATKDSVFIAYFGNDTAIIADTLCFGDSLIVVDKVLKESGHYEFSTLRPDGLSTWNIVDLYILPAIPETVVEETILQGEIYFWNGKIYAEAGIYFDTLTSIHGCDSVVTLQLNISNSIAAKDSVTACDSYTWNDSIYTASGEYTHTSKDSNGNDSITILYLTIHESKTSVDSITVDDSYEWNDSIYTSSGIYTYTTTAANGCDSTATLYLTINSSSSGSIELTITACDSYEWNGTTYTTSGNYVFVNGKDSVTTIHLTILESKTSVDSITADDSYEWNDSIYTSSGIYTYTTTAANGCDSTAMLYLTITHSDTARIVMSACDSYTWNGSTYTTSGEYRYTTTDSNGNDSTTILHLTINYSQTSIDSISAYDSYTWNDSIYTTSGVYTYTTTAANGCDSTAMLYLTIVPYTPPVTIEIYDTICAGDAYVWSATGQIFTKDTVVSHTSRVNDVDSVYTLHLKVLPAVEPTIINAIICYGDSMEWNGVIYASDTTITNVYTSYLGCDSVVTFKLVVREKTPTAEEWVSIEFGARYWWNDEYYYESGDYTITLLDQNGCDMTSVLHLTVLPPPAVPDEWLWICPGDSLEWNGELCDTAGYYAAILTDIAGQDSVVVLRLDVWPEVPVTEYWDCINPGDTYHWMGNTYTETGDYTTILTNQNGCDSTIVLHLTVLEHNELTIIGDAYCADDPYMDFYLQCNKTIEKLILQFPNSSLWRDTIIDMPGDYVEIPSCDVPGEYSVKASAYVENRAVGLLYHHFTLKYPSSVLQQHWDSFIGVLNQDYNGGYDFVGFQWYKNDKLLVGETGSNLITPLEMGAEYSVMLEDVDGRKLMTCPIVATEQGQPGLYPTYFHPNQLIPIHSSQPAVVELYDITGQQLLRQEWDGGDISLLAPSKSGIYIVLLTEQGNSYTVLTRKITIR